MLRVVIDTNVLVSALLNKKGVPARILGILRDNGFTLLLSFEIVQEVVEVLVSPKIKKRYVVSRQDLSDLLTLFFTNAELAAKVEKIKNVSKDPDDDKFLACASASAADWIISGDKHLLTLKEYQGIRIINARDFLKMLEKYEKEHSANQNMPNN